MTETINLNIPAGPSASGSASVGGAGSTVTVSLTIPGGPVASVVGNSGPTTEDQFLSVGVSIGASAYATLNRTAFLTLDVLIDSQGSPAVQLLNSTSFAVAIPWAENASALDKAMAAPWGRQTLLDVSYTAPWSEQSIQDVENVIPWGQTIGADFAVLSPWARNSIMDPAAELPWAWTQAMDADALAPWSRVGSVDFGTECPWSRVLFADVVTVILWTVQAGLDAVAVAPWGRVQITDISTAAPWARMLPVDVSVFQPYAPGVGEIVHQALYSSVVIPWLAVSRIIMTNQNIVFKRVSDDAPVHVINPAAEIDLESWMWSFSGTLPSKADADLIRPGADGNRETEVYLSINGYEFKFFVKGVSENYAWAKGTYSFSGRSKSVIFGADYCPEITQIFDADPVQSVVADVLEGTGWTWDWDLLTNTWNLDSGSLSVAGATKMDVLSLIAKAVGGTIQTDPAENTLKFMSRMPVSPENWAAAAVDATILSGIMSQGVEADPRPGYNQVIVSGQETGVIGTIRRTGTAGDVPAPPIIDPLLTNQAVITERGRVELAENGFDFINETLLLPLPGVGHAPALLLPGKLVEITDLFSTWRGLVCAVAIVAETAKTRQRVTIKRKRD